MKESNLSDSIRVQHILDAILDINIFITNRLLEDLYSDAMLRMAIIKELEIIGEAAGKISNETKQKSPDTQWRNIIALRNILVHEYFGVNNEDIWRVVSSDLQILKLQMEKLISS